MGCVRLEVLSGRFPDARVVSNHDDLVPATEKLLDFNIETIIIFGYLREDALDNRIRSNE